MNPLQLFRVASAGVWLYQGLVPKLLGPHADEVAMISALGVKVEHIPAVAASAGWMEIALACCIFAFYRHLWPHLVSALALTGLLAFVATCAPHYLGDAFNPVATNIPLAALSIGAILMLRDRDSARPAGTSSR